MQSKNVRNLPRYWPMGYVLLMAGLLGLTPGRLSAESSRSLPLSVSIIPPRSQDEVTSFAIQDLERYLRLVMGAAVPVGNRAAGHRIFVGEIPRGMNSAAVGKVREEFERLQEDGFLLRTLGADLLILGKGGRGNLYGCYALLEHLGVRWYFPGKEYEIVPRRRWDWTTPIDATESPAFPKRILFYWPNHYTQVKDWIDFAAKARLNRMAFHYTWPALDWYINLRSELLPELRKRGMEIEVAGHFLSTFLPRTLFTAHPDWFRLNEAGQRMNDFNFNPFNLEALDNLASGAVKYLLQMPEAKLFHLWADDIEGGGWSHEPGKEAYTPSDQALLVCNYLVKALRRGLPEANLAFLAYHDTVYPPRVVKPEAGLIYFYAPRERCYAHGLDDPQCPLNQKYSQALERGLPAFGRRNSEVFEYYVDQILYENMTNPPLPKVLSADVRYYHRLGIPAVGALMTNTSNFVTPMVNMFLYPQALWNLQRDLEQSLNEYGARYFGDAGLSTYFQELSRGLAEVLKICSYEHPGVAWDWLRVDQETEEALGQHVQGLQDGIQGPLSHAASLLNAARNRAANPVRRARLEAEQVSLGFTLQQAKLYYHLLKAEQLYRIWKTRHEPAAGLGALTEAALARYTWEKQKQFVAQSRIKGSPLIPEPRQLEQRVNELMETVNREPGNMGGVNISEFGTDSLVQHLMKGVSGVIVAGPTGSRAVLWTEEANFGESLKPGGPGLSWADEFGQPLRPGALDRLEAPVVIDALGMPSDKLFDALVGRQPAS